MIRLPVLATAAALALTAPAAAQAGYMPPERGSVYATATVDPTGSFAYDTLIVAVGEDFVISRDVDAEIDDPTAYYVEFSGFFLLGCDEELPDAANRSAMQALWPLTAGEGADLTFAPGARVRILAERDGALPDGTSAPGYAVTVRYGGEDSFDENLLLLDGLSMPVLVTSPGASVSTLTAIVPPDPQQKVSLPGDSTLQNCASLF